MKLFTIHFPKISLFLLLSFLVSCGGGGGGGTPTQTLIASISVEPRTANLARGGLQQFSATARDAAGNLIPGVSFSWSSDNPNFINIDSNGLGSGLAEGMATIRASAEGVAGTATAAVKAVQTIDLSPAVTALPKNSSLRFNAIARAADTTPLSGATFTWSTDNATFVAIDQNGLASGVAQGTATISASADGISQAATVTVTDPLFAPNAIAYTVEETPESAAVGDFDGDGVQDIAVTNVDSSSLSILKGAADGSFTQPYTPLPTGGSPFVVAAGRFDGNTIEDLAVANFETSPSSQDTLSIFLGNSAGPTVSSPAVLDLNNGPISLTVADFNGDGKNDIAIANLISETISVIQGNGDGTFGAPDSPMPVSGGPVGILAAQLDADDDNEMDLAVALGSAGKIALLFGVGNGTFSSPQMINVGTNPNAVAAGDWNGDGKTDLAVVNSGSRDITLLFGDGTGAFPNPQTISPPGAINPRYIVTGDFNGDNFPDLVVSDQESNTVSILLNNDNGAFGSPIIHSTGLGPLAMTVGRFDADNLDDLAVVNSKANTVSIFLQFP